VYSWIQRAVSESYETSRQYLSNVNSHIYFISSDLTTLLILLQTSKMAPTATSSNSSWCSIAKMV